MRGAVKQHRSNRQREHSQGQLLQDCRAKSSVIARESDLRFDLFFPFIEVVLHLARKNLAVLRIHAADVRRKGIYQSREYQQRNRKPAHGRAPFAVCFLLTTDLDAPGLTFETWDPTVRSMRPWGRRSRARSFCSLRVIWPWSDSWS